LNPSKGNVFAEETTHTDAEGHAEKGEHHEEECETEELLLLWSPLWWSYIGIVLFFTCFAGLCSGLTVGMIGIEKLDLEMAVNAGKESNGDEERKQKG